MRFGSQASQPSDAALSSNTSITEHSQVRLEMADADHKDDLDKLVGQRVTLTGTVQDDGRNTIGTAGREKSPEQPEPRTDTSQAASKQSPSEKVREEAGPIGNRSMNNGTFPVIRVQAINQTGETCTPTPVQPR